jgi:hypothetical protein
MKSIHAFAFGLAATCVVPFAQAQTTTQGATGSTEDTTTAPMTAPTTTETTGSGATGTSETWGTTTSPTYGPTYGTTAPGYTATTTTSTTRDVGAMGEAEDRDERKVRRGLGLNAFGQLGTRGAAMYGAGARIEYVLPMGLSLGGSYQVSWAGDDRTTVRPLLGEVGWTFPIVRNFEVRPMVGIGYAFASANADTAGDGFGNDADASAAASVTTSGLDVAPGAKISFLPGGVFEVYTLPKYHFITGRNFVGVELGAGARF